MLFDSNPHIQSIHESILAIQNNFIIGTLHFEQLLESKLFQTLIKSLKDLNQFLSSKTFDMIHHYMYTVKMRVNKNVQHLLKFLKVNLQKGKYLKCKELFDKNILSDYS